MTSTDSEHAGSQSDDKAHADVGIVSALPLEMDLFLDRCERVKQYKGGNFVFRGGRYDGIRVAVVESGLGFAAARKATQALIDAHTPPWVLACGFAGALQPQMSVGDVVMANSLVDTHGQELTVDVSMEEDRDKGLYVGRVVTADHMVRSVDEKKDLAEQHQAVAVDMESLAVAQVCSDAKTRFLCIRAISDDMSADLPPEVTAVLGSSGTMRLGAAVGAVWKRPGSVKDMWKLREQAQRAAERLADFLDGVLGRLYEESN